MFSETLFFIIQVFLEMSLGLINNLTYAFFLFQVNNIGPLHVMGHQYNAVFRNSIFHHPSFLRDVIGSDQHIGMLSAPCFVSGVPLRACKHASSYYVHSPVAGKGMLESIFFLNVAPQKC